MLHRFRRAIVAAWSIGLLGLGCSLPCVADDWADERVAGPFVCRADFPLDGIDAMFNDLAELQGDLVRYLGIEPAGEPVELYLFRNQWSYNRFLRLYFPQVPYRRALYIKNGGRGIVLAHQNGQFEIDVRHECTHALLHAALPMVPLWLDEGLAEYFEAPRNQRASGSPHLSRVRWNARFGVVPSMSNLEKKSDLSQMDGAEYRDSWAWAHFMLHGPVEAHDEMVRFLRDIQASTPPGLLSDRLEGRVPRLDDLFLTHFRNKSWER